MGKRCTNNSFIYSDSNKRYHTLDYYYKHKYGCKVFKVSLNMGCSCPNVDGKKGYGGCLYCHNGSGDFAGDKSDNLKKQFSTIRDRMLKKWPNASYIAYFQAGSNTYGDVKVLSKNFEEVLGYDGVVGINIATRADCIDEEWLKYLDDLNKRCDLVVEIGLQSSSVKTAKFLNLGYTRDDVKKTVLRLHEKNIKVVIHIINGLPFESKEMMVETAKFVNSLNVFGIKIHMLHILRDTPLDLVYKHEGFDILSLDDYVDVVIKQLEVLDPNIVINRITGDPDKDLIVVPNWLEKKFIVLNEIDKEMVRRDTYQGKRLND